jgi:hypothetical protein
MKSKTYKRGSKTYKAYFKPVGNGFEVGFMWGTKPLFVGNFINNTEATTWYKMMNYEINRFSKKFWHNPKVTTATAFYNKFITNSLYKHYYDYLDKCFGKYTKSYHRNYHRDLKTYNRLKKNWPTKEVAGFARRAA